MEANAIALNQAIKSSVNKTGREKTEKDNYLLNRQLTGIFISVGQLVGKQSGDDFFRKYMAAFFYKMAQSPHMPVFSRMVSGSTEESKRWLKENASQVDELKKWVTDTERGFNN